MNANLNKAIEKLQKNNQEHIIPFLEDGNNDNLVNQVLEIDFEEIKKLYKIANTEKDIDIEDLQPIVALNPCKLQKDEINNLQEIGTNVIKEGKYAVCTMAGRTRNKASDIQKQKEHTN